MTTYGWSYNKDDRPSIDKPSAAQEQPAKLGDESDLYVQERKRLHPQDLAADSEQAMKKPRYDNNCKIFVGGFPSASTEKELHDFFNCFGSIVEVNIKRDSETQISRGFGWITYETKAQAEKAVSWCDVNKAWLHGRKLWVDLASNRRDKKKKQDTELRSKAGLIVRKGQLYWQYKLEDTEETKIYGAYTTEQMLAWWEKGHFDAPNVLIRQVDEDGEWTPGSEIDFSIFP